MTDGFFDFNNADQQQGGELIPAKTMCKVVLAIRPGQYGDEGWLTKSDSGFEYLNLEATVCSMPHAKRKIFQNAGVGGPTDGHQKAAQITRSLLRAMLESARGIDPKDESDAARQKRQVNGWGDFQGLELAIEVGIEKDKSGNYPDKNKIQRVITPDHSKYQQVMAGETIVPEGARGTTAKQDAAPKQQQQPAWGGQQQNQQQAPPQPQQQANPVPSWAT